MDSEAWLVPVPDSNARPELMPKFAPVQSCFLHVPVLPSKRRYETENEVVLLDDVRLSGQLNSKLWEEFSEGMRPHAAYCMLFISVIKRVN